MKFCEIIGHKQAIEKLTSMVDNNKLPHALLLHGPSGIGKMRVARAFVQYLNCENRADGDSCGKCPSCLQTAKLNNPDLHYIFPVLKRNSPPRSISADYAEEWRNFINNFPYMPEEKWLEAIDAGNSRPIIYVNESAEILRTSALSTYGKGKNIYIVWLPEKMNVEAANKLLKVLEEPNSETFFLFVSNNPGEIIPTIRSRLQDIQFTPLSESDIINFICSHGISYEEAESMARMAKGNMNRASMLLESEGELKEFSQSFIGVMRACYSRKMVELKKYADTFASFGREKTLRLIDYFARMVRESFISNTHISAIMAMSRDETIFVEKFGPFINTSNVEDISKEIDRLREDISRNANQKIVWFDFLLELTRLIRVNNNLTKTSSNK